MHRLMRIGEVAEELNRVPHTIREWERTGRLPEHLRPRRFAGGWRYWSEDQVDEMKQWMVDIDLRPGKIREVRDAA